MTDSRIMEIINDRMFDYDLHMHTAINNMTKATSDSDSEFYHNEYKYWYYRHSTLNSLKQQIEKEINDELKEQSENEH